MWLQSGSTFRTRDPGNDLAKLPAFIYTITPTMAGPILEKQQDAFEFPYKLYGASDFPERVAHHYSITKGNLGILMTGIKGTGKTVEAELICNKLGLPIVLVTENFPGLVPFLNSIPEDVVIFIDEYEKIFERSSALLSLMDGALRTRNRRIFLLTTNETWINDAMLNRPSRLFYSKRFGNLEEATILEIVADMLPDQTMRRPALTFIAGLEIITVDIVKAVCAEMIRFSELPEQFKAIINVRQRARASMALYHLVNKKRILISTDVAFDPVWPFDQYYLPHKADVEDDEDRIGHRISIKLDATGTETRHDYENYGNLVSMDIKASTFTTTEGTFVVAQSEIHPALQAWMSVAV